MTAFIPVRRALRLLLAFAWLLLVVGAVPSAATAQPGPAASDEMSPAEQKAEAARLKKAGDEAMLALRYEEALAKYSEAYAIEPRPALLYNRGRSLQALGRFPESLDQFEQFEREAPETLKARVPKLQELIEEVRGKVSVLVLTCNVEGAQVLVRQRLIGETPLDPTRLSAGAATVQVTMEGYVSVTRKLELQGSKKHSVDIELLRKGDTALLVVRSPTKGAMVHVNGKHIGTVPSEVKLKAGTHEVVVSHDGYQDAEQQVVLRAGTRREIDVLLEQTPPVYETWWFWTGIGVVVTAAAVVAIAIPLTTERDPDGGDIEPGVVSAPLLGAPRPLFRF